MALFKEINCSVCGEKTSMLTRSRLKDGSHVCGKCKKSVPGYIKSALGSYTLEEFQEMKQYLVHSKMELQPVFTETAKYKSIHLDAKHGLFYVDELGQTLYLKLQDVVDFTLSFEPQKAKEGLLFDKVIGTVNMSLTMGTPYFVRQEQIASGVKTSAEMKGIISKKMVYVPPKAMEEFLLAFHEARRIALESEATRVQMEIARLESML